MKHYLYILTAIICIALTSCKPDNELPIENVITSYFTVISSYTTAIVSMNIICEKAKIDKAQLLVSEKEDMSDANYFLATNSDTLPDIYTAVVSDLSVNTKYYCFYKLSNLAGYKDLELYNFETMNNTSPEVTTLDSVYSITGTSAFCGGNVLFDGGLDITSRGVCWSVNENPTIDDTHTSDGSGTGTFTSSITGLSPNTNYYVRAYATNTNGTSYGEQRSFMTVEIFENKIITVNGVSFTMIAVEGGTFWMGAQSTNSGGQNYDSEADSDESPVHQVTLSDYYIGETEVTQKLWLAVMGSWPGTSPNSTYGVGDNYPAYYVSWDDCQNFITALNAATGKTFRLPTEAEWEYAARGGNKSNGYKYSGSNTIGNVAWYTDNSGSKTHSVGSKSPNELGIYDMSGNVWEWCSDWYGSYSNGSQTNPAGPSSGSYRVLSGGSWSSNAGAVALRIVSATTPTSATTATASASS